MNMRFDHYAYFLGAAYEFMKIINNHYINWNATEPYSCENTRDLELQSASLTYGLTIVQILFYMTNIIISLVNPYGFH